MTEREWLNGTDPEKMLRFLRGRRLTARKRRLFACACCWHISDRLREEESRRAIEVAERFADGLADHGEREAARRAHQRLSRALTGAADRAAYQAVREILAHPFGFREQYAWRGAAEAAADSRFVRTLLHDLFGNPFRPVALDPTWRTPQVVALAQAINQERVFDCLPVLADALEEAGCDSAELLAHCRAPGPHVRGCWLVDLVLGKESP
jgi:hypothetical protein